MNIQPEDVIRDECGFWTHSQYPDFEGRESISKEEWEQWCTSHGIKAHIVDFTSDVNVTEEECEKYFDDPSGSCATWQPTPPKETNAFLFSLHETENGPVAIFAIPLDGSV